MFKCFLVKTGAVDSVILHEKNSSIATTRGGSRTVVTSKMERFVIIVNGWKPLTIITKRSMLDVAAVLDPPRTTLLEPRRNKGS